MTENRLHRAFCQEDVFTKVKKHQSDFSAPSPHVLFTIALLPLAGKRIKEEVGRRFDPELLFVLHISTFMLFFTAFCKHTPRKASGRRRRRGLVPRNGWLDVLWVMLALKYTHNPILLISIGQPSSEVSHSKSLAPFSYSIRTRARLHGRVPRNFQLRTVDWEIFRWCPLFAGLVV